ncbi:hypothetical protein QJS04_geneDACA018419 [Acorus gramineus]|uniref:Uncharacterized protein n=1 Tax=Acorus gramineus TaxID=55184 RepID=A0AAV9AEW7_ACOGR|nr:hypothetical protein QJS04_geneDACA018419 [Acorus gramineus]
MFIEDLKEGESGGGGRVAIGLIDVKRSAVGVGARALFYPTLLYNVVRNKCESGFHWWDEVDEFLLLGAVPFPSDVPRLKQLGVRGVVTLNEPYETLVPTSLYQVHHRHMTPAAAYGYVRLRRPRVRLATSQWKAVQEYYHLRAKKIWTPRFLIYPHTKSAALVLDETSIVIVTEADLDGYDGSRESGIVGNDMWEEEKSRTCFGKRKEGTLKKLDLLTASSTNKIGHSTSFMSHISFEILLKTDVTLHPFGYKIGLILGYRVIPAQVGSAAAYLQTGVFFGRRYLELLAASILIITWLNLSNDVFDFDTGVDKEKRESVVNLCVLTSSRSLTHIAAMASLTFGFFGLIWVSMEVGDIRSVLLLSCAIICGYIYQVRIGTQTGSKLVKVAIVALYLLVFVLGLSKVLPPLATFLCALTIPIGKAAVSFVEENHRDKFKIFMAKYFCVRLHTLFGVALAIGLAGARAMAKLPVPRLIIS